MADAQAAGCPGCRQGFVPDEAVQRVEVDVPEVTPGQFETLDDVRRRLPGEGLVMDALPGEELACMLSSRLTSAGVRSVSKVRSRVRSSCVAGA